MQASTHRNFLHGVIFFALAILSGSHVALAQAHSTAAKSADISAFAGYTHSTPDYGPTSNSGITIGADYTRYFGWIVAPSLEIRAGYNTGDVISQKTLLVGPRVKADFRRFHPYADALFGGNSIHFKQLPDPFDPNYTHDSSFTISYGAGLDFDVIRNFQAKVDFQVQNSNYGFSTAGRPGQEFTLSPTFLTVGVVYRIPFRKFDRH